MMLLAQLPSPGVAQSMGWVLLSLAGLAVALRSIIGLWRDISRPSGADVQAESVGRYQPKGDYATRTELLALTVEIQKMKSESDQSREDLRAHLDTALNDVRVELATKIDDQAREFGQALREQPSQIVALLRNTGALK